MFQFITSIFYYAYVDDTGMSFAMNEVRLWWWICDDALGYGSSIIGFFPLRFSLTFVYGSGMFVLKHELLAIIRTRIAIENWRKSLFAVLEWSSIENSYKKRCLLIWSKDSKIHLVAGGITLIEIEISTMHCNVFISFEPFIRFKFKICGFRKNVTIFEFDL